MTLFGVDLSKYQAGINWSAVKSAGIEYAIARASIGLSTDPTFGSHKAGALTQGILPGAYHFLMPGSGSDQADVFASMTNGARGILAALDCESQGLTIGIITDFAERFAERSDNHPLFIYTGPSFWRAHGNPPLKDLGPLWLAFYPGGGYQGDNASTWDLVLGGVKATIWQYGPRPIKGRSSVDGDAFRGTRAELEAFTGAAQGAPQHPEEPVGLSITKLKPISGTVTVQGAGHSAIRVSDGAFIPVADGYVKEACYTGLLAPLAAHPSVGGPCYGVGDAEAVLLARDVTFASSDLTPFSQFDIDNAKAAGYEAARKKAIDAIGAI